uniref:PH domain-containing protein n=1 Tax=Chrysotila carterae TaxID=13221 RepID=A0A7S4B2J7_CHRCT|mmetsp:Transcript_7402/g.16185  ORF Transcript_7402/g.16185 Transcript_7402/m.16185 type:complete len:211 (+) Transcript_7402:249-881(+)
MLLRRSNSFRREVVKRGRNAEKGAASSDSATAEVGTVNSNRASRSRLLHSGLVFRLNGKKWSPYFAVAFGNAICFYSSKSEWTSFRSFPSDVLLLNELQAEATTAEGRGHCIRLTSASSDVTQFIALSSNEDCIHWLRCLSPGGAAKQVSRTAWVDPEKDEISHGEQPEGFEEKLSEAKRKLHALALQREKLESEAKDILHCQLKSCFAL